MQGDNSKVLARPIKRVILAESSRINVKTAVGMLKKTNMEVYAVYNAEGVLHLLETPGLSDVLFNIQAVVIQQELTHNRSLSSLSTNNGLNTGLALYSRIRSRSSSIPVVIYTNRISAINDLRKISDHRLLVLDSTVFFTRKNIDDILSFFDQS